MLIRSQNRELLISFEKAPAIGIMETRSCGAVITCSDTDETLNLGSYSTKGKAMKVMNMIQEAYADEKVVEYTLALQESEFKNMTRDQLLTVRAGILKKAVFQMPDENDVEE